MKPLIPTLSLLVTYTCNIECGHCGPYCGPHEKDWMTVDEMQDLILQASALGARNVVFTGGEPTLLGPKLIQLLRFVRDNTSLMTRIVSNAKWAYTPETAHEHLKRWRDAGLDELNVSCGEYHQEFVPITSVANAYRAACDLGYETVLLAGEFIVDGKGKYSIQDYSDAVGEELMPLEVMSPFSNEARGISYGVAMRHGRGKQFIPADHVIRQPNTIKSGRCSDVLSAITAHPNGNVTACCGVMSRDPSLLNIGDWRSERLETMLTKAHSDRVLNWIRYVGLKDMKEWLLAKDPTLTFEEHPASICDLCAEIVYSPRCQELLNERGTERDGDIVANKVAMDALATEDFVYRADGSPVPGRR